MQEPNRFSAKVLRVARSWWCAPLLCSIVATGMLLSTPTFGAPDSAVNLATGWYDIHHVVPTQSRVANLQLGYTGQEPCYALHQEQSADCVSSPSVADITSARQRIANYPPPFYWILGVAEVAMSPLRKSLEGDAARVLGLLATLALLFWSAWRLHRARERSAIWSLYLLTPPMAAFLFAGANPNGWEIACALFFTSTLLFRREELLDGALDLRGALMVAIAALLLATARPSGGGWLVLITLTYIAWFQVWRLRRSVVMLAAAVFPGVLFSLIWNKEYGWAVKVGQPSLSLSVGSFFSQLSATFQGLPDKATEAWGVLGWLDTWPSELVVLGIVLALVYYLPTYAPTRAHRRLLVAIVGISFIASSVLEAFTWKAWPSWWQGRYSLTLLAGLSVLLFSDPSHRERPGLFALAGWVSIGNAYMVCLNYWRYDYGVNNGFPFQVAKSAYGLVHTTIVYFVVLVLLAIAAALFIIDRAARKQLLDRPTNVLQVTVIPDS